MYIKIEKLTIQTPVLGDVVVDNYKIKYYVVNGKIKTEHDNIRLNTINKFKIVVTKTIAKNSVYNATLYYNVTKMIKQKLNKITLISGNVKGTVITAHVTYKEPLERKLKRVIIKQNEH